MFILSGGFPLISVSQGMVLVLYPSLSSPGGSSTANSCVPAHSQPLLCLETSDPSAVLAQGRGWDPHKVPGEVAHHRIFYLFQLPQHHFCPAKKSFGYFCTSILLPPSISSLLLPAQAGISHPHPCWAE